MNESEKIAAESVTNRVRSAGRAIVIVQALSQIVSLVVLACLYRLLDPSEFGLFSMVLPLVMWQRIVATWGLHVAAVQRTELSDEDASLVFWFNLVAATAVGVLTACAAPAVAWFYDQPELVVVTIAVAPIALLIALGAQPQALVERRLLLGRLAFARLAAQVAGGLAAIGLAVWTASAWPLVMQQYVELAVLAGACWGLSGFRPRSPWRGAPASDLVQFGGYYTGSSLLFYVAQHADKVLIGVMLGPRAAGLYQQAYQLMMKPVYLLTTPVSAMMLPALARVRDDRAEFDRVLLAFLRMTAIVLLPAGLGLCVVGSDVMRMMGGEAWLDSGILLQVLAVAIVVQGFFNLVGSIYSATGNARRLFAAAAISTALLCAGFVVGFYVGEFWRQATLGIAIAYSVVLVGILFVPYFYICLRTVGVSFGDFVAVLRRPLLAALVMAASVAAARAVLIWAVAPSAALLLVIEVALGVATYAILAMPDVRWLVRQMVTMRGE